MKSSEHEPPRLDRVAVIAVHGVADQPPAETVRALADMLLRVDSEAAGHYSPFLETGLRIPVAPVVVNRPDVSQSTYFGKIPKSKLADDPRPATESSSAPAVAQAQERSAYVKQLQNKSLRADLENALADAEIQPPEDYGHHFMREQLRDYVPRNEDKVYSTQRLSTQRIVDGKATHELHLYEMYWGDLSKLGGGVLRIVGELYQLLFHVGSLGRQTVDFALAEHLHDRSAKYWRGFSFFQTWASRLLTLTSPILNLFLLAIALMLLPTGLTPAAAGLISQVVAGAIGFVTVGYWLQRRQILPWILWALAPWLAAASLSMFVNEAQWRGWVSPLQVLMVEWAMTVTAGAFFILRAYDKRRPGALKVGMWIGMSIGIPLTWLIGRAGDSSQGVVDACLPVVEGLFLLIGVNWMLLGGMTLGSMAVGYVAIQAVPRSNPQAKSRAWRAAETAWLTLSLPSVMFLLVTLLAYQLTHMTLLIFLGKVGTLDLIYHSYVIHLISDFPAAVPVAEFLDRMIVISATPAFGPTFYLLCAAGVLSVWGLFPGVMADIYAPKDATPETTAALGKWLSDGYRLLYVAAFLLLLAFPFFIGGGMMYWAAAEFLPQTRDRHVTVTFIVGSLGGLLAFHGRLESLAMGFRPVLDAILDVDNYLREHPRDNNPRSRICARYASLLRYISAYRDPIDGQPYSGIVIVSHSQGTVISAELLRFLRSEFDPALIDLGVCLNRKAASGRNPPLYLMTMGCPLRQLYGWRFPHLYRWTRHDAKSGQDAPGFSIPEAQHPDPRELGVTAWINAYRSGDYVGRYLWRTPDGDDEWSFAASEDARGMRREFCIGAGAHTHYFDDTAPEIAVELDRIVGLIGAKSTATVPRPLGFFRDAESTFSPHQIEDAA